MITDIKKVIETVKADKKAAATVTNDVKIKDVSIIAAANANVDYWCTLSLKTPVRGMYPTERDENGQGVKFAKGLTSTVMVPLGTIITCLFDALLDIDSKDMVTVGYKGINGQTVEIKRSASYVAKRVGAFKDIIVEDAKKEAITPNYTSHFHELLFGATINVITRDVFKEDKKVKSLFSLNDKEHEIERDSVWHDIYGINNIDNELLGELYQWAVDANDKKAEESSTGGTSQNAVLAALQKAFAVNSAAGTVNAALS